MTIDDIDIRTRGRGSQQLSIEQPDAAKEQRITTDYGKALFWQRVASIAWWMLVAPPLLGRYVVAVAVAVVLWLWIKPHQESDIRDMLIGVAWVGIGATLTGVSIGLGVLDTAWYPVWWGWRDGLMPLTVGRATVNLPAWFVWFRAFLIIAPPLAWDRSFRLVSWRFVAEIVAPSSTSITHNPARASSVAQPRGSPVTYRDPDVDPAPIIEVQPTRITPLRVAANARPIRTIELPFGSAVEVDRLVAMLEADEGFSWRTWRRHEWTRGDWESACQILAHAGIISEPQSGKTTERLVSVDEAVQRIEDMG